MATVPAARPPAAPHPVLDWTVVVFQQRTVRSRITLGGRTVRIGRDAACEIVVDEPSVSRVHCVLAPSQGGVLATDLGSTNGTWRFGERVRRVLLQSGDELSLGKALVKVVDAGAQPLPADADLYAELYLDPATGLHNRRGMRVHLDGFLGALPAGTELGLVLARIAGFEAIGEKGGLAAQRVAKRQVAQRLALALPRDGLVAALGGADFALVVAGRTPRAVAVLADTLRARSDGGPALDVGVSCQPLPLASLGGWLCVAEDALYRATRR